MNLREKKKQRTAKAILASASALFRQYGFAATSLDQIAANADVARGTLFNYYASKDAIVLALASQFEENFPLSVSELVDLPGSSAQRVSKAFELAATFFNRHRRLNEVIFMELVRIRNNQPGSNDPVLEQYTQAFRSILQQGQRDGDVRPDINTDRMAELLSGTLASGIYLFFSRGEEDIATTFSEYADLLIVAFELPQARNRDSVDITAAG